ncbi:MAG: hypothetical protein IJ489_05175 [Clostridia bacterium]|nr:hypothetical protein [Clostridia bacterium]
MSIKTFFKNAFSDMKADAKAQHEVDKANMAAVKAESKAQWEEAKAMGKPETHKAMMQKQRDEQIADAKKRETAAKSRIDTAKK